MKGLTSSYGLIISLILLMMLKCSSIMSQGVNIEKEDMCYNCHGILDDERLKSPAVLFKKDIHFTRGVSCASCHGGDHTTDEIELSMDTAKGFVGVPKGAKIARICSSCHKDQFGKFSKSIHGIRNARGVSAINSCVDCHGIHDITKARSKGSRMLGLSIVKKCASCHSNPSLTKRFNAELPNDQFGNYRNSPHGKRLLTGNTSVPTCVSCHSNHDVASVKSETSPVNRENIMETCGKCHSDEAYMSRSGLPTDQFEKYKKSVHGVAVFEAKNPLAPLCTDCHGWHGEAPKGVASFKVTCGRCHESNMKMFENSPHQKAFEEKGKNFCSQCHGSHDISHPSDEMLGVGEKSVCIKCHDNDKGYEFAKYMKQMLDSLNYSAEAAGVRIAEADIKGMNVIDGRIDRVELNRIIVMSKTSVHSANPEVFKSNISKGFEMIEKTNLASDAALKSYYSRRLIPGISAVFIFIFLIAYAVRFKKVKNQDKPKNNFQTNKLRQP